MAKKSVAFFSDYQAYNEGIEQPDNPVDAEREYPLEKRCCITGEEVKSSFCRYPDSSQGTMMVMSRETMLEYSRDGLSLSDTFEQILLMRRKLEGRS